MPWNLLIKQIENVFEESAGTDIDWSARPSYVAAYITADHVGVGLCYDSSPATDDSDLASKFWTTYDNVYRAILTMLDLGTWERVRRALAAGQFGEVDGLIAYAAIQVSYQS
jgi:hypothetical protein